MATIGVIAGDGVGPEVVREGLAILDDVATSLDGLRPELVDFDLGGERYLRTGEVLPDFGPSTTSAGATRSTWAPSGHPGVAPGILEKGILLKLRFDFHQYINLRPDQACSRGRDPDQGERARADVDMVVVRENNEDLYVGAGGFTYKGTPEEVAIQTSINTRAGVERCLRYAFRPGPKSRAKAHGPSRAWTSTDADRARGIGRPGDDGRQDQRPDLRP